MSYNSTPHVCFKVERSLASDVEEFPRLLERQLRAQFDSVRVVRVGFLAPLAVELRMGAKTVPAVLGKSKYEADEWIFIVDPLKTPGLLDRLLGRKVNSEVSELMLTCRVIHEALTAMGGITAVRWYFEGGGTQSSAVEVPDELPWPRESRAG